jgi:hypothetical protein
MQVEEASLLWHKPSCFYKNNQRKWFSRWSNQGIQSHHLSATSMICFLLRASLIPITQITPGYIILDKNVSFLNMNYSKWLFIFSRWSLRAVTPTLFMGWTWSPQCYMHQSLRDKCSLPSVICITIYGMNLVSLVLYAPISYDEIILPNAICTVSLPNTIYTNLQGMNLVSSVLYAPLFIGWICSSQCYKHHSRMDRFGLPSAVSTTLQRINMVFLVIYAPLSKGYIWSS